MTSLPTLSYAELLESFRPYIVQVDEDFAKDRLRDAVIEFSRESNLLAEEQRVLRQRYVEPTGATGAGTTTQAPLTDAQRAQGYSDNSFADDAEGTYRTRTWTYIIDPGGYQADRILEAKVYQYGYWYRLDPGFYANQVVGTDRMVHVIVTNQDQPPEEVIFTFSKTPLRTGDHFPRYFYDVYKEALLAKAAVVMGKEFMRQDRDWPMYYNVQLAKILESMATRDTRSLGFINGERPWPDGGIGY